VEYTRQHVLDVLRRAGLVEEAEQLAASLPDTIDSEEAAELLMPYGITKDELVSRMGGSS
jgi:hypothetical protein